MKSRNEKIKNWIFSMSKVFYRRVSLSEVFYRRVFLLINISAVLYAAVGGALM